MVQFLYWTVFFVFFKLFFMLFNHATYSQFSFSEDFLTILHGLRMDIAAAGYLTIAPALCLTMAPWFPNTVLKIIRAYTIAILPILVLMGCADAATFTDWQTRLSVSILNFLSDPQGVWQSLSLAQWIAAALVYAVILALAIIAYNKLIILPERGRPASATRRLTTAILWLMLSALLILPIRGTLGNAPINPSTVSFSPNIACNYGAYNFFWNFMFTALNRQPDVNPLATMPAQEAAAIFQQHFAPDSGEAVTFNSQSPDLDFSGNAGGSPAYSGILTSHIAHGIRKPRNVVILLLESFSAHLIGALSPGAPDYCPRLSDICRQGITFDSCYASGNRSDKGVSATLLAYPSLVNYSSILAQPQKLATATSLPKLMGDNGFATHFAYGGDIDFYNTKLLLLQSGVKRITERSDFTLAVSRMQKWGAPDQYLYQRYTQELDTLQRPFFSVCYNISSHPPFDVPVPNKPDNTKDKIISAMHYADSCLGVLLDELRRKPVWDSTLVVIISDHTASLHEFRIDIDNPECYRIPLILTGGVIDTSYVCHNICSQTDIMATIADICQIPRPKDIKFSHNIFTAKHHYAFFFRDEVWGYISPQYSFVHNNENGNRTFWYSNCAQNDSVNHLANAYAQHVLDDYLDR